MAQYKLHCFSQSGNSYKVALYLNCAGLEWDPVFVDFFNGQTRKPEWREAVNEIPRAAGAVRIVKGSLGKRLAALQTQRIAFANNSLTGLPLPSSVAKKGRFSTSKEV